jgi:hypothetical protein
MFIRKSISDEEGNNVKEVKEERGNCEMEVVNVPFTFNS